MTLECFGVEAVEDGDAGHVEDERWSFVELEDALLMGDTWHGVSVGV